MIWPLRSITRAFFYLIAIAIFSSPSFAASQLPRQFSQPFNQQVNTLNSFEIDLRHWVAINSGSLNEPGLNQMAKALKPRFEELGFQVSWSASERAFIARKVSRSAHPFKIFMLGHLDTVFEPTDVFQKATGFAASQMTWPRVRPLKPFLRGPGAVDAKGGIGLMREIYKTLNDVADLDWTIFIAADEESGSKLSKARMIEAAQNCDLVLVYEPGWIDVDSGLANFALNNGGNIRVDLKLNSSSSLARKFGAGAPDQLMQVLQSLVTLRGPKLFVMPYEIDVKSKANVSAQNAVSKVSIRFSDDAQKKRALDLLHALSLRNPALESSTKDIWLPREITSAPLALALKRALTEEHIATGRPEISMFRSGAYFLSEAGIPSIDGMGPVGGDFHSQNEWIALGSVEQRIRLSQRLILNAWNEKSRSH